MRKLILLLLACAATAWGAWPNGYTYRRSITIAHAKVPNSNQTNFPVLLCFNGASGTNCDAANSNTLLANLKTVGNGGQVQNTVSISTPYTHTIPADVIVTDTDGSTVLPFEVVTYTATSGLVEMWVKIGTLTTASDYVIYIYYGNASVTTNQSSPTSVWDSNYKAVYHQADNAASTVVSDSTSNTATATNVANTSGKTAAGQVSQGLTYNGSSDKSTGTDIAVLHNAAQATLEAWVKFSALADFAGVVVKTSSGATDRFGIDLSGAGVSANTGLLFLLGHGLTSTFGYTANSLISTGNWYHIVQYYDGSQGTNAGRLRGWINGVEKTLTYSGTIPTTLTGFTDAFVIGADRTTFANAIIDEVRISSTNRSPDWIVTSYNNQNSPNTFWTLGAETTATGGAKVPHRVTQSGGVE